MAKRLKNHIIVCGCGVFAQSILEMLYVGCHDVVVISGRQPEAEAIRNKFPGVPLIEQPPTDELTLAQANLAQARCVVAATRSDVDNLLISMTCKDLNPELVVYSLSLDGKLAGRMAKLGVDEVICPYLLGGTRVAELIESGVGSPFAPAGKVFKEWAAIPEFDEQRWTALIEEAIEFVDG